MFNLEETKETKMTIYLEENEKSEEEKLRKVSKEIIDEYDNEVFAKTFFTSVLTLIPLTLIIVILENIFTVGILFLIVSISLVIVLPTIFYIFYKKKFLKENEDFKLAKEIIKRYTDLEKEEKNKEKIKETLEKNKENSKNIKMMKEFLNK